MNKLDGQIRVQRYRNKGARSTKVIKKSAEISTPAKVEDIRGKLLGLGLSLDPQEVFANLQKGENLLIVENFYINKNCYEVVKSAEIVSSFLKQNGGDMKWYL